MFLQRRLFRVPPLNRRVFSSTPQRGPSYARFGGSRGPLNQFPGSRGSSKNGSNRWESRVTTGLALGGVASVVYYVSHLEQVPETGRWRFMNTSPAYEAKLGEASRQETRRELAAAILPPHHPVSIHVRRVVARILEANNLGVLHDESPPRPPVSLFGALMDPVDTSDNWNPDAHFGGDGGEAPMTGMSPVYGPQKVWDVIVVNDKKTINAMVNPGMIVVFTGILPVCQDEEGLAAVLSHEIGHVVARHIGERISSQTVTWGILIVSSLFLGIDSSLSSLLLTYLLELPNSREQETEADLIGLRLMSKACYDPAASPKMFARMENKVGSKSNLSDFLDTHPSSEKRIKLLESKLHEGYALMAQNPQCDQLRQQLEAFKASARPIGFDGDGHLAMR